MDGIFYKHRKTANITDFAILLGGYVSENNYLKVSNANDEQIIQFLINTSIIEQVEK